MSKRIVIDGNSFSNMKEFYDEMERLLTKGLSWKPGRNLNAFNDLLRGGFGVHEYEEELIIDWIHAEKSRRDLALFEDIIEIIKDSDNTGHYCVLNIVD